MNKEDTTNLIVILLVGIPFGIAVSVYWKDLAWFTLQAIAGLVDLINWIL